MTAAAKPKKARPATIPAAAARELLEVARDVSLALDVGELSAAVDVRIRLSSKLLSAIRAATGGAA